LKIDAWGFEKRPILPPGSICLKWKANSKSIAEWINGHHTRVGSPRLRWDKSLNSTPRESQNMTLFRMRTDLKNLELRPLWGSPFLSPEKLRRKRSTLRANSVHSAQTAVLYHMTSSEIQCWSE
jgi:hypothetical protein